MTRRSFMYLCAVAGAIVAGCGKPSPAPIATTVPATTRAAATQVTTRPAAVIHISDHEAIFPPARMRLEQDGDRVVAMLFSDDPKEALRSNYTGNSFYLRMELDIAEPAELATAQWHCAMPSSSEREDSPYGIFLSGRKTQLQPFDVRATFHRENEDVVTVSLAGQFATVDPAERGPAKVTPVAGELTAHLDQPAGKP